MIPTASRTLPRLTAATLSLVLAAPALAHHPVDGRMPATALEGLLSGIGHPVIGLDHLAFLLAAGLIAAWIRPMSSAQALRLALVFGVAGALGTLLRMPQAGLPGAELGVALSVLALGACLLLRRAPATALLAAGAAVAGLMHGYAFGEAVIGAEATPVVAYLAGLGAVQAALLVLARAVGRWLAQRAPQHVGASMRAAGTATLAVGLVSVLGALTAV
jgi:urease accessory protein